MFPSTNGFQTNQTVGAQAGDAARARQLIKTMLLRTRTAMPVSVESVSNAGGVEPIGYVDIKPLVGMLDGSGTIYEQGIIYNVPYLRIHGGSNAVILDPEVGDIGMAVICDRDISVVKNTGKPSPPGSKRSYDVSDAVYLSSIIGAAPSQYVRFSDDGIEIVSPVAVNVQAPTANVTATESATVTAPDIRLGATGQTLRQFVTSAFMSLFNVHTHNENGSVTSQPNQQMTAAQLTTVVKGG